MNPQEASLADAKLEELRAIRDQVNARIKQIEEAKTLSPKGDNPKPASYHPAGDNPGARDLEARLLKLDWKTAKSGSCEYVRSVPADLLSAARAQADSEHEITGEKFHYVIKEDGAILRFKRRTGS